MFSLPLITPANDFSPFLSSYSRPIYDEITPPTNLDAPPHQRQQTRRQQDQSASQLARAPLAQLKADEESIRKRKENIARFGSTWIKPPGISKTLQAETEERQEREEQEILARREQMLMDMQAQQEAEEARQRAAEQEAADEEGEGEVERDLDEEIPDAEGDEVEDEEEEEEDEDGDEEEERDLDEEVPEAADVTFNDESLLEGSMLDQSQMVQEQEPPDLDAAEMQEQERYAQLEEAEVTGIAQDQYDLGMEGNLDESVPEAGNYEHTDTELDDTSEDEDDSMVLPPAGSTLQQRAPLRGGLFDNSRRSLGGREAMGSRRSLADRDASSILESSFIGSSPILGRMRSAPGQRPGSGR